MMQDVKASRTIANPSLNKVLIFILILTILASALTYVITYSRANTSSKEWVTISPATLEEKYGLQVRLVAVTAAGGFVDVRIKIVDGDKAKLLLTDSKNFPVLSTKDGVILNPPEDTKSQAIRFDNNANMFIMYPNPHNAIRSGSPVIVLFGDMALEPVNAK